MKRIGRIVTAMVVALLLGPIVGARTAYAAAGLSGHVFDALHRPVAGASVYVIATTGTGVWTATTDNSGLYQVGSDLTFPPRTYSVSVAPPTGSGSGGSTTQAVVAAGGTTFDITLPVASTVSGVVRGPNGPLAGVTVGLGTARGRAIGQSPTGVASYLCPRLAQSTVISGADGSYTIGNLGTMRCPVWFEPPANSGLATEMYPDTADASQATLVTVATGGTAVTGIDAVLEQVGSISGLVLETGTDRPVTDTRFSVNFPSGAFILDAFPTNADGAFTIPGLKPGAYDLTHSPGTHSHLLTPLRVNVVAGTTTSLPALHSYLLPIVTITSVQPTAMAPATHVSAQITGENFAPGASVAANLMLCCQVKVTDTTVVSPNLITATFTLVPFPEREVPYISVTVTNADGSMAVCKQCVEKVYGPNLPQTITFTQPPPSAVSVDSNFLVSARSSAGLDVTLAATGSCSGTGTNSATVTAKAPGTCIVGATQIGNAAFASAEATTTALVSMASPPPPPPAPLTTVRPERLLDTRPGSQNGYTGPKPAAGQTVKLKIAGRAGVPTDATAVVMNITGTDATDDGYVTVWPCGTDRPDASSLNLTPGTTSPNAVITKLSTDGTICLYTQNGTHLLADITGYFPV
jgi:hypothetical protein